MGNVQSLQGFYSYISSTPQRLQNQFQLTVTSSSVSSPVLGPSFAFYCTATSLPGKQISAEEIAYQGIKFKLPGIVNYGDSWNVTVHCDNAMVVRTTFEQWMNIFSNIQYGGGGQKTVPTDLARIDLLTPDMQNIASTYVMAGIFPSQIGDLQLSYDAATPSTFDVTFAYQYWYPEGTGQADPVATGGLNT